MATNHSLVLTIAETADSGNDMLMYIIAAVAGVLGAVILFSLLGSCKDKPDKKGEAR